MYSTLRHVCSSQEDRPTLRVVGWLAVTLLLCLLTALVPSTAPPTRWEAPLALLVVLLGLRTVVRYLGRDWALLAFLESVTVCGWVWIALRALAAWS